MKRMDRLSGEEMAAWAPLRRTDLGVVWGLVQQFHAVFCAENDADAEQAWTGSPTPTRPPASTWARHHTFCRWGTESMKLHKTAGQQRRLGGGEHRIEVLERMAYGFASGTSAGAADCSGTPALAS